MMVHPTGTRDAFLAVVFNADGQWNSPAAATPYTQLIVHKVLGNVVKLTVNIFKLVQPWNISR